MFENLDEYRQEGLFVSYVNDFSDNYGDVVSEDQTES